MAKARTPATTPVQPSKKARTKPTSAATPLPDGWVAAPGMSDESVVAKTGRAWAEWVALLDDAGAPRLPHRSIAALLAERFDVDAWWAQTITVGYERIRGLREVGQRRGGLYEASRSRTFNVGVASVFAMFDEAARRAAWLPDGWARTRTSTPGKSIRVDWADGTEVHVYFTAKGEAKTLVAVQHVKLPDQTSIAAKKAFWSDRLDALDEALSESAR